ncbi:MAG: orotidine-5'-phosphate decarboxylase, partial [Spirochaetota bacterium]|nr:orotidine-5'-phosphate decarboxylase [Spirochaetota bacterium]
ASFTTVHGNDNILKSAVEAREKDLKILAVTVLTSLDRNDLIDLGFQCNVEDLVLSRARRALEIGCDGVISSGLEAAKLRDNLGNKFLIITPGIRPVDNKLEDDQKRVATVEKAFQSGADYIVVGRPIKNAENPYQKAIEIQNTIKSLFHK